MFSQAPKEWSKPMLVRKRGYVRAHLDNGKRDPRYCMAYSLAADMVGGDSEYNILIDTLAEASARFEELQRSRIRVAPPVRKLQERGHAHQTDPRSA